MKKSKEIAPANNKEALVVKGNTLIMSRYNLSLAEQRLILQVVSMINKDDEDFKNYAVYVSDYLDLINSNSPNTYQKIKEFSETLLKKPLHIPQDDGGFFVCNWFAGLKYEPKKGMLICSFHPNLRPYLLQLKKNFTSYRLKNILSLSSKYSIRLYEILKRYEGLGSILIDLAEFRELLAIPDSYFYKNIKQQILKPLQKEFKMHTDVSFSFEEVKNNKKVTTIKFTINSNLKPIEKNQKEPSNADYNIEGLPQNQLSMLLNELPQEKRTHGAERIFSLYLQTYDADYIKRQIEYVNKQKPNNYFGYLKKAIEEDYTNSQMAESEKARQQKMLGKALQDLEEERQHSVEVSIDKEKSAIYSEYLSLLDEKEKEEFLRKYFEKAKKLYPDVKENSFEMEFKVECLAVEDIIADNNIYQIRLSKVRERAEKQAQAEFERSKESLYSKLKSNLL